MAEKALPETENKVRVTKGESVGGEPVKMRSVVIPASPQGKTTTSEVFTREVFENALDKVSRPVKGKYADVPYSSEDLIRDKREEVGLEDR